MLLSSLHNLFEAYKSIGCPLVMPSDWGLGHWNDLLGPDVIRRDCKSSEECPVLSSRKSTLLEASPGEL